MPSTSAAGAVGEGGLDALVGGVVGMLPGSFVFAQLCPRLERFLKLGSLGQRLMGALPPMHELARQVGIDLPAFLGKAAGAAPAASEPPEKG